MTSFIFSKLDGTNSTSINNNIDSNEEITTDDNTTSLNKLDTLLSHTNIGRKSRSASEFIELDSNIPVFNEWNDIDDHLIIIGED